MQNNFIKKQNSREDFNDDKETFSNINKHKKTLSLNTKQNFNEYNNPKLNLTHDFLSIIQKKLETIGK